MKICVIIPTYNEAQTIGSLIKGVLSRNLSVLTIDDGSRDNTSDIARSAGATVLSNTVNQGKGAALIKGFSYALKHGFDAVITMDGDGQHDASDIPRFIESAAGTDNAVIVGNRMASAKCMPITRLLTNKFMSCLISQITKQEIPDTQCGFRLIKRQALEKMSLVSRRYEIESEILLRSALGGFRIGSIPIRTIYGNERSQINPVLDTFRFFSFIVREIIRLHRA